MIFRKLYKERQVSQGFMRNEIKNSSLFSSSCDIFRKKTGRGLFYWNLIVLLHPRSEGVL